MGVPPHPRAILIVTFIDFVPFCFLKHIMITPACINEEFKQLRRRRQRERQKINGFR